MGDKKRYVLKILGIIVWSCLGMGTIVLLVAAMNKKNSMPCSAVDIQITGVKNNFFIDKQDVGVILGKYTNHKLVGKTVSSFNLAAIENELQKNEWIKRAEVYFDNNNVLKVSIIEREPIARVFNIDGSSFYIDTARVRLPLSSKFSARVPVFTNFPIENGMFSKADSNLLTGIRKLSEYIFHDPFWMAQVEQVDISSDRTFEIIPKIGNQVIVFGGSDNYSEKFNNLLMFYRKVESKTGWNKYSRLDLRYKGQVLGVKRGAEDIKMDSLRTKELMQLLVANALKQASDTVHNIQLVQPAEDNIIPTPVIEEPVTSFPVKNPIPEKPVSHPINKPGINKPITPIKQNPKPTTNNNDY